VFGVRELSWHQNFEHHGPIDESDDVVFVILADEVRTCFKSPELFGDTAADSDLSYRLPHPEFLTSSYGFLNRIYLI
jgi:hypothetical protein